MKECKKTIFVIKTHNLRYLDYLAANVGTLDAADPNLLVHVAGTAAAAAASAVSNIRLVPVRTLPHTLLARRTLPALRSLLVLRTLHERYIHAAQSLAVVISSSRYHHSFSGLQLDAEPEPAGAMAHQSIHSGDPHSALPCKECKVKVVGRYTRAARCWTENLSKQGGKDCTAEAALVAVAAVDS